MLADFQTALADLTASPALCRQVRADAGTLRQRYDLTDKEWRRLTGIAASRGMEVNCMLYRANRIVPMALNLPQTCEALGEHLDPLISAYWEQEPTTGVNFLVEADRFCRFLCAHPELPAEARRPLEREHRVIGDQLAGGRRAARADGQGGGRENRDAR